MFSLRPGVAGAITEEISSGAAAKTAVLYLRVSTSEQATRGGRDEGFSIPAQREAGLRKAESLGAVVVAEFIDAGESGTSAEKRPDLQRMLTFVSEQPVDYCIVHKVDRLARNRADDVAIHFSLKQAGVTLVSVSENIDETPSGRLMHGIMSSIAEFYSLNLANEVTKGMAQKASLGGTVGRAPLGYKNVHLTDEHGRINRTVHVDPDRAHLITWAFYRYAEGDCSLNLLLQELTARGLTTRPTPKWPSKPLGVSTLHKVLHNPYYKGQITYCGAVYPGVHEPLVDPLTWQQVQDYLAANNLAGTRQRTKPHYLRGSVYCSCGSRLLVERATNRWGTKYEYFVCSGRKRKTTTCERQAMPVDLVEGLIEDQYRTITLAPELRDKVEQAVLTDFETLQTSTSAQRRDWGRQRTKLVGQRQKLLDAHYAGAIPIDLLKSEQERIVSQLGRVEQQLADVETSYETARTTLTEVLDLLRDCHAAYLEANGDVRRLFNQAFFNQIVIEEDDETHERSVHVDLNKPFDALLDRATASAQGATDDGPKRETARRTNPAGGLHTVQGSDTNPLVAVRAARRTRTCPGSRCPRCRPPSSRLRAWCRRR